MIDAEPLLEVVELLNLDGNAIYLLLVRFQSRLKNDALMRSHGVGRLFRVRWSGVRAAHAFHLATKPSEQVL